MGHLGLHSLLHSWTVGDQGMAPSVFRLFVLICARALTPGNQSLAGNLLEDDCPSAACFDEHTVWEVWIEESQEKVVHYGG